MISSPQIHLFHSLATRRPRLLLTFGSRGCPSAAATAPGGSQGKAPQAAPRMTCRPAGNEKERKKNEMIQVQKKRSQSKIQPGYFDMYLTDYEQM